MNNTSYSTGTVSIGASSTTLTGSGTAWLSSGVQAGDVLVLAGALVIIASVNSNTSITLRRPWPGVTQSGANYDILLLDDATRGFVAANLLLQALGAGTLTSLGQIAGAANQMPYWTGAGVMAQAGLTSEARTLLASTLLSRSGNNLVTAALARITGGAVQSSLDDATAGKILLAGAFGLGDPGNAGTQLTTEGAANALRGWRIDRVPGANVALVGGPPGASAGTIMTIGYAAANQYQLYCEVGGGSIGRIFRRYLSTGGWGAWILVHDQRTILGAVSQSGGAPTGAVIERGSNANGEYVRFADGTQICTKANTAITTAPAAFSGTVTKVDSDKLWLGRWF